MAKKTITHMEYENRLFLMESEAFPVEEYINSSTPILHECIYGHTWKARPNGILQGKGCPKCKGGVLKTTSEYIEQLLSRGIEVLEEYINAGTPLDHRCRDGHEWKATPTSILRGSGCPICSYAKAAGPSHRFDINKPALLYYIKIDNKYYKIGITNKTIDQRFRQDKDKDIKIIWGKFFISGQEAADEEAKILEIFKNERIYVPGFLSSKGNTELFKKDILGLDND